MEAKVNRIKWDEEMNNRCMERIRYLSPNKNDPAKRKGNAPEPVQAIGIGGSMECKWVESQAGISAK